MTAECSQISDTIEAMRVIDEHLNAMQDDIRFGHQGDLGVTDEENICTYVLGLLALNMAVERITSITDPSFFSEEEVQYIMSVTRPHLDFLKENTNE